MFAYEQDDLTVAVCSKLTSIPDGAAWIEVNTVPDRKHRSAWRITGDSVTADASLALEINRLERVELLKTLAIEKIVAFVPAINTIAMIDLMTELWAMLDQGAAGADIIAVKNIYVYAKGKISEAKNSTQAELDAYDPSTDNQWPSS